MLLPVRTAVQIAVLAAFDQKHQTVKLTENKSEKGLLGDQHQAYQCRDKKQERAFPLLKDQKEEKRKKTADGREPYRSEGQGQEG